MQGDTLINTSKAKILCIKICNLIHLKAACQMNKEYACLITHLSLLMKMFANKCNLMYLKQNI